ncbi:MAG: FliA/WhiG family RNA polymerase sigma factor [Planctomycetaceae bacterium]|jgi:RNA polymerase sigma factor for flagellar operon FliA|nr:FliA/WhiG family RNA polymerase sigma factor [Planctomycetaceae bacterium]
MTVTTTAPTENIDQLWVKFKENISNTELRNRLVEKYMPIVRHRGERIWSRLPDGVELDDLISAGTFGLMDAINAFDLERGVRFETFCIPRIQGAMLDELRSMDWVPRMVRSKASKINEAYKILEGKFGRKPSNEEMAEHLLVSVAEFEKMLTETHGVNLTSLDKKWFETDSYKDVREIDVLADKRSEDPTERLRKTEMVRAFTRGLTKNERLIIILYYFEEMTMKEIGMTLELSESRVSQMHTAIVDRMRKLLMERKGDF